MALVGLAHATQDEPHELNAVLDVHAPLQS
jgi:hypothetical protein